MNVWEHADSHGHDYITPEDVTAAIADGEPIDAIRLQVLEALAKGAAEDWQLCAHVAHRGTPEP